MVFLHGYDDHSGRYAATHERLAAAGYRVRTFDFRGHGRSEGARGFCREWREYLADLEAALATETGAQRLVVGDWVTIPAGLWHWHGATPEQGMCHVTVQRGGPTDWDVPRRDFDAYPTGA